jgi:hypothetical protein
MHFTLTNNSKVISDLTIKKDSYGDQESSDTTSQMSSMISYFSKEREEDLKDHNKAPKNRSLILLNR